MSDLLPTDTVTAPLGDAEGSTRLWETQPQEMAGRVALLDRTVSQIAVAYVGAWLADLRTYSLRDLPCTERVTRLGHPGLRIEFPPLRTPNIDAAQVVRCS